MFINIRDHGGTINVRSREGEGTHQLIAKRNRNQKKTFEPRVESVA